MNLMIDGRFNIDQEYEDAAMRAVEKLIKLEEKSDRKREMKLIDPRPSTYFNKEK